MDTTWTSQEVFNLNVASSEQTLTYFYMTYEHIRPCIIKSKSQLITKYFKYTTTVYIHRM